MPDPSDHRPGTGGTDPERSDDGPADPRRQTLIASLRQRFALAEERGDAAAKRALFQEAAYLNLPPELWQPPPA